MESYYAIGNISKRGGKIPDKTLNILHGKIYAMGAVAILLLAWLYAVALQELIRIFQPFFGIGIYLSYLSIIVSLIGIGLGLIFYTISLLKSDIRRLIKIGIPIFIVLTMLFTYLGAGTGAFLQLLIFFIKIGFSLVICTVPIICCYGLLKKQKSTFLAASLGIMFFFFFTKILLGQVAFSLDQIELILLFFVLYICFLEIGTTSIYFSHIVDKMTPNESTDEAALLHFNSAFNRYLLHISVISLFCYVLTLIIFQYNNYVMSFIPKEIVDVDFSSVQGMLTLMIFTLAGAFIFWYLIPREKTKKI